jgi:hypothetical protein
MNDFSLDLRQHLLRQMAFSVATFGPGARHEGVSDHIRKELIEIKDAATVEGNFAAHGDRQAAAQAHADMDAALEWVDVAILALDGLTRSLLAYGMSRDDAARHACVMVFEKQGINEGRTWPDWRTAEPGKAIEHLDDGTPGRQEPEMDDATPPSAAEAQSGLSRVQFAEGLIQQIPDDHDGRNTWLLNYGTGDEAKALRLKHAIAWDPATQSAEAVNRGPIELRTPDEQAGSAPPRSSLPWDKRGWTPK